MTDQIIETKKCAISGQAFTITQGDVDFYDKISPTFAGQKFAIPTPTLSPEERQRRRLAFRNERNLYRRTCDASGKQIISIYSPDKPYKIYDQKVRRSDSRDPMEYGRDFDFSKTFTENFRELMLGVPRPSFVNLRNINSEYNNYIADCENCYYCFDIIESRDVLYSTRIKKINDCLDNLDLVNSNNCYEVVVGDGLTKCKYAYHSYQCYNSMFLIDCKNVNNSFFCSGIENKDYYLFNKPSTKEDIEQFIRTNNIFDIINKFYDTVSHYNQDHDFIIQSESSIGYNVYSSKNCIDCSNTQFCHDCKFCDVAYQMQDCYDTTIFNPDCSLIYGAVCGGFLINSQQCISCWECNNLLYSDICFASQNLFGCIGLRSKSYCIFNKQYTKEEYENQVAKIITHMQETGERGEFFHPSLSPFGYNETVAQEYYPVETKNDGGGTNNENHLSSIDHLSSFGYKRSSYEAPKPVSDKVMLGKDLPTSIDEVQDDILQYAIACEVTGKLFRIQPQELVFYRKHHIPLPRKHPDQRHLERLALRK